MSYTLKGSLFLSTAASRRSRLGFCP